MILAAAAASGAELSGTASLGWESRYVFRGAQLAEDVLTPAVNLASGDCYAGVWMALPTSGERYRREADLFAGWSRRIAGVASVDFGLTRYAYGDFAGDFLSSEDSLELYAGVTTDLIAFSPSLYLYRDFDAGTVTAELKAGHSFALGGTFSLDLAAVAGRVDYDEGGDRCYGELAAGFSVTAGKDVSFALNAHYALSDEDSMFGSRRAPDPGRASFWIGAAVSCAF